MNKLGYSLIFASLLFIPIFTVDAAVLRTPPNNLGLVGYWSFEDGSGSTATDFSGSGNAGTLTNMDPGSDWVSGKRGTALDFDGSDDYVDFADIGPGVKTLSFWVKPNSNNEYITQLNGSTNIQISSGSIQANGFSSPTIYVDGQNTSSVTIGEWNYVTITTSSSVDTNNAKAGLVENVGSTESTPQYDNTTTKGITFGNYSYDHTVSGSDRILFVSVTIFEGGNYDTSVTYAGESMTPVGVSSQSSALVDTFMLIDPPAGTNSVSVEPDSGPSGYSQSSAISFTSADQTDGIGATTTAQSSGDISATITPDNTSSLIVDALTIGGGGSYSVGAGQTLRWGAGNMLGSTEPVSSADVTMSWTETTSNNNQISSVVTEILPATSQGSDAYFSGTLDNMRMYNRALSASEVRDLYQSGYAEINRTAKVEEVGDPVGWWTFDGQDMDWSADTAQDRAGSNDGILNGGMSNADSKPGRVGQALDFDGLDDHIDMGSGRDLTKFTLSAWVKKPETNSQERILVRRKNGGSFKPTNYLLDIRSEGKAALTIVEGADNDVRTVTSTSSLDDNQWHHVVGQYDGADLLIFVDGVWESTQGGVTSPYVRNSQNINIGYDNFDGDKYFDGKIDDVRVYDKVLSADEIQKIYDATRPSKMNASQDNELTDGLVGMWSFNGPSIDWSSNTATDVSANSNDGTITNMSTSSAPQPGVIGQALAFDGSDDYVEVPDSNSLSQDSTISVSLWMKGKNVNSNEWNRLIEKVDSSKNEGWGLQRHQTDSYYDLRVDTSASSNQDTVVTDTVLDNQWHHLLFVLDNGEALMYQDGEKVDTGSYSEGNGIANNSQLLIANSVEDRFFPGKIDQVRIYDRALSEAEIKRLYRLGR